MFPSIIGRVRYHSPPFLHRMGARRQAIVAAALALVLLSQLHGTQALLVRPQLTCGSPKARHSSRSSLLIRGAPLPCTTMMANPAPRATAGAGGGVAGDIPGAGSGANRGHIVLGSKSFTRKMIVEEMGFTPIVRYGCKQRLWFT